MNPISLGDVTEYVERNIDSFHGNRRKSLESLKLEKIICRKNPYLFRAKHLLSAPELVKTLLDAFLSSQEETIFGRFLEGLAIFINGRVYGGRKSSAEGIDLEFERDDIRYIVSIKSGPNWGNASQIRKMKENFRKAKSILRSNMSKQNIVAVNGCCYGRCPQPQKEEYIKLCGQKFWEFISGNNDLYVQIIEPLGHKAKEKNDAFQAAYAKIFTNFTHEFTNEYCIDGVVNWEKLVQVNSAAIKPRKPRQPRKKR